MYRYWIQDRPCSYPDWQDERPFFQIKYLKRLRLKTKSKNKEKLRADLQKYSKQMGILPNEVPKLVLDRNEMRSLVTGRIQNSKRLGGYGECFYPIRTIFVDASYRLRNDEDGNGHRRYRFCQSRRGSMD